MNTRKSLGVYVLIGVIVIGLIAYTTPLANSQFVLSTSGFPDEYGQGIERLYLYENSTGSWVALFENKTIFNETAIAMNYTASTAIQLLIGVNINHTLLGLSTTQEALDIMRVNISVMSNGVSVFSQNNVTHGGGLFFNSTATTWRTFYDVVINVIVVSGISYLVTVIYGVYY